MAPGRSRNTETVTFSLPPQQAQNLRQVAREERTVSELLREAIRLYMEEREWRIEEADAAALPPGGHRRDGGSREVNGRSKGGKRIYHGWLVVAASMIILSAAGGMSNSFSVFVLPLSEEFGWSRAYLVGAFAIAVLMNGLTQPIIGHLFDRYDSRRVILVSVAVAGFASVGLDWTSQYWHLIVLFSFVFSTASGGASFGILGPLAARWFLKRRTLVLALLLSAPTMGSIFFTPTAGLLLASYGWREAWIVLGSVLLFPALPLGLVFLRNWPSEMGLKADGDPESPVEASMRGGAPAGQRGRFEVERWWRTLRSPPVYALLPAFAIAGFAISPALHIVNVFDIRS